MESSLLETQRIEPAQVLPVLLLLWLQGGLPARQADSLLSCIPALQPLLQPITDSSSLKGVDEVLAYCLTSPLLAAKLQLSQLGEWQLAVLGLDPTIRQAWLQLAAARCLEAGAMADPLVLVKLISQLGDASTWVLAALDRAGLGATAGAFRIEESPLGQQERSLLGVGLHENAAIPALCRILRVSFSLHRLSTQATLSVAIAPIDQTGKQLASNWCSGRLLALPDMASTNPELKPDATWLLVSGALVSNRMVGQTAQSQADDGDLFRPQPIHQFAKQPWLFLLSLLVFVQDAWAAEQRGGLLLRLPVGQNAYAPSHIELAVQGSDGDEVNLGCLASFLMQVLDNLGIGLYPALDKHTEQLQQLNRALGPIITQLLSLKIWQFSEGGRGEPSLYRIHSAFSDACYSLPLAPLFGYKSQAMQQAIKWVAQNGYSDKKATSSVKQASDATDRINPQGRL